MNYLKAIGLLFIIPTILFSSAFGARKTRVKICPQKRVLDNPIMTAQKRTCLEINQQDEDGNTQLHRIILSYCPPEETARVLKQTADLLRSGADLLLKNNADQSSLDIIIDHLKRNNNNSQYIESYKYKIKALSELLRIEIPEEIAQALRCLNENTDDIDQLCSNLKNLFSGDFETEQLSLNLNDLNI